MGSERLPVVLSGPTAGQFMARGMGISFLAFLCVVMTSLESFFGSAGHVWGATWVVLCLALTWSGFMNYRAADPKNTSEVNAGYTTLVTPIKENPQLWSLHSKSLQVIARPGESWPPRVPRAKKWAALHPELPYAHRAGEADGSGGVSGQDAAAG